MLVVLASRFDAEAQRLVEEWASNDARLLTCDDLASAGWICHLADAPSWTAVIEGRREFVRRIRGVLTRLPWVQDAELPSITASDRPYVAAEMAAFLTFWLSELKCRVLNRPAAGSLNGPTWRSEQWKLAASRLGMRVSSGIRHLQTGLAPPAPLAGPALRLVVVGDECFGAADDGLKERACRLAKAANVGLLGVDTTGPEADATFLGATLYPALEREDVRSALLEWFS